MQRFIYPVLMMAAVVLTLAAMPADPNFDNMTDEEIIKNLSEITDIEKLDYISESSERMSNLCKLAQPLRLFHPTTPDWLLYDLVNNVAADLPAYSHIITNNIQDNDVVQFCLRLMVYNFLSNQYSNKMEMLRKLKDIYPDITLLMIKYFEDIASETNDDNTLWKMEWQIDLLIKLEWYNDQILHHIQQVRQSAEPLRQCRLLFGDDIRDDQLIQLLESVHNNCKQPAYATVLDQDITDSDAIKLCFRLLDRCSYGNVKEKSLQYLSEIYPSIRSLMFMKLDNMEVDDNTESMQWKVEAYRQCLDKQGWSQ